MSNCRPSLDEMSPSPRLQPPCTRMPSMCALVCGYAIKLENSNEYNYYCPDRKVWEEIGYFQPETA